MNVPANEKCAPRAPFALFGCVLFVVYIMFYVFNLICCFYIVFTCCLYSLYFAVQRKYKKLPREFSERWILKAILNMKLCSHLISDSEITMKKDQRKCRLERCFFFSLSMGSIFRHRLNASLLEKSVIGTIRLFALFLHVPFFHFFRWLFFLSISFCLNIKPSKWNIRNRRKLIGAELQIKKNRNTSNSLPPSFVCLAMAWEREVNCCLKTTPTNLCVNLAPSPYFNEIQCKIYIAFATVCYSISFWIH